MSPERGGQETGEQLHSILAAELSRRWRWVERERERETRTRYCTTKSGLGTTVWELVAGICRGSGLSGTKGVGWMREGGGREGRGTYYHDVSIVPEDRKLIGRFVILYRRWLVSWLDYLQPRFPVYISGGQTSTQPLVVVVVVSITITPLSFPFRSSSFSNSSIRYE